MIWAYVKVNFKAKTINFNAECRRLGQPKMSVMPGFKLDSFSYKIHQPIINFLLTKPNSRLFPIIYFSNGSTLLENFCQNNEPDFRNGSQEE